MCFLCVCVCGIEHLAPYSSAVDSLFVFKSYGVLDDPRAVDYIAFPRNALGELQPLVMCGHVWMSWLVHHVSRTSKLFTVVWHHFLLS